MLILNQDCNVLDDIEDQRVFSGTLNLHGKATGFRISAKDFADNNKLRAAITAAGGPGVQIYCKEGQLRTAISAISSGSGIVNRTVTTNFGWTPDRSAYLVQGGRVTAAGFEPVTAQIEVRVDLSDEEQARYLDLRPLPSETEVTRVKTHIVEDLLHPHDRRVTHCLLAAVAAAVLWVFFPGVGRFALWLTGLTGSDKSFLAKLFMNFFGAFPVHSGRFVTWAATANYIQRQGHFFKDALYLVDDYKPEVIPHYHLVRVLQNFADKAPPTQRPGPGTLLPTSQGNREEAAPGQLRPWERGDLRDRIARQLGCSGRSLDRWLRILKLPLPIQQAVEAGDLSQRRAIRIAALSDTRQQADSSTQVLLRALENDFGPGTDLHLPRDGEVKLLATVRRPLGPPPQGCAKEGN